MVDSGGPADICRRTMREVSSAPQGRPAVLEPAGGPPESAFPIGLFHVKRRRYPARPNPILEQDPRNRCTYSRDQGRRKPVNQAHRCFPWIIWSVGRRLRHRIGPPSPAPAACTVVPLRPLNPALTAANHAPGRRAPVRWSAGCHLSDGHRRSPSRWFAARSAASDVSRETASRADATTTPTAAPRREVIVGSLPATEARGTAAARAAVADAGDRPRGMVIEGARFRAAGPGPSPSPSDDLCATRTDRRSTDPVVAALSSPLPGP